MPSRRHPPIRISAWAWGEPPSPLNPRQAAALTRDVTLPTRFARRIIHRSPTRRLVKRPVAGIGAPPRLKRQTRTIVSCLPSWHSKFCNQIDSMQNIDFCDVSNVTTCATHLTVGWQSPGPLCAPSRCLAAPVSCPEAVVRSDVPNAPLASNLRRASERLVETLAYAAQA